MKQQLSIQALRGIASLGVLLFHMTGHRHFGIGAAGVDIFFVLSGFVMWHATAQRDIPLTTFWKARLIRIAPLYYVYTALFCLMLYAHQGFTFSVTEIAQSVLFIPFTNSLSQESTPILGVGWTLNYEVFFYLAFGCTLALPNRATRFKVLAIALGAMVCLRPLAAADSAIAIRDTSPLFMEFLMGMAIGAQLPRIQRRSSALGGALITIAIALLIGAWLQWPQMPKTIATGIPAALLVAGALMLEDMIRRQRWLKPLQALGDASYSMYLVHGLILALIEWYAPAPLKSAIALPAWIAVMLAASFASHRWVETPLLNAMRTWTNSHPRQATP